MEVAQHRLYGLHVEVVFDGEDAVVPEFEVCVLYQAVYVGFVVFGQFLYEIELIQKMPLMRQLDLDPEPVDNLFVALGGVFLVVQARQGVACAFGGVDAGEG